MLPVPIRFSKQETNLESKILPFQGEDVWLELEIPRGVLEPGEIIINPVQAGRGLVISGKLPRWLFASIVHKLAPNQDWIAIDDPRLDSSIVVHSQISSMKVGDVIPRLA